MGAQAKQAGPGLDREDPFPVGLEAAGPASPRLVIEEVKIHLGNEVAGVTSTLVAGRDRFTGSAACRAGERPIWELAAAASVVAIQHYLRHNSTDPSTPQVQLLDVVALTTGIGQEVIAATVRVAHDNTQTDLHGSVLVHNDRSRTAVAAALNAVSRYLGRFRPAPCEVRWKDLDLPASAAEITPPQHAVTNIEEPLPPPVRISVEEPSFSPVSMSRDEPVMPSLSSRSPAGFPSIGVVISPPAIHAAAIDSRGAVLADARRPVRTGAAPEVTLSLAVQAIREVVSNLNGAGQVTGIGIAMPGQVLEGEGVCVSSGEFPNWRHVPLTAQFAGEFSLPVSFISPAHAAAYAEFSFGAARGIPDLLYVRVGADIDAALILGGRPALTQLAPGQAGHTVIEAGGTRCICGESGCWQALAGREALIARVVKAMRNGTPSAIAAAAENQAAAVTPALIVRMAGAGDVLARRALEETGNYLGIGLANLIALFGPQAVIVESQPAAVGAALLRAAEASLKSTPRAGLLSHCVLLSPELGESSAVIGAAVWAARNGS